MDTSKMTTHDLAEAIPSATEQDKGAIKAELQFRAWYLQPGETTKFSGADRRNSRRYLKNYFGVEI